MPFARLHGLQHDGGLTLAFHIRNLSANIHLYEYIKWEICYQFRKIIHLIIPGMWSSCTTLRLHSSSHFTPAVYLLLPVWVCAWITTNDIFWWSGSWNHPAYTEYIYHIFQDLDCHLQAISQKINSVYLPKHSFSFYLSFNFLFPYTFQLDPNNVQEVWFPSYKSHILRFWDLNANNL